MPQTVSPVDPIPSLPSAKSPAGGTLCEWHRHTCASLAHRYGASLPAQDRQGGSQPGWEGSRARALLTQEEDLEGDGDGRLLGRDAASLPWAQRGVDSGSSTPHEVGPGLRLGQSQPPPHGTEDP